MYYYLQQNDGSYDLIRQKFGSEKTVTLLKNVNYQEPVVVDKNRMFYGVIDGGSFVLKELNMNTKDKRTMLTVSDVNDNDELLYYHGEEYDFVIGSDVYKASSNLTSSARAMKFGANGWKY